MEIKQHGKSIISTNEVNNIIKLMIKDDKNFKHNTVSKIIIWNSKLLFKIYSFLNSDSSTQDYKDVINGSTVAQCNNFFGKIELFVFNRKKEFKNLENKKDRIDFLKLTCAIDLAQEFINNSQLVLSRLKRKKEG